MTKSHRALGALLVLVLATGPASGQASEGARAFDFEIGNWRTELKRLVSPLAAPAVWAEYTGTTVVSKVWVGDANLVELDVTGARGHIRALSLRLYDPASKQWSLNFANATSGAMAVPSVGDVRAGRGEFLSHEVVEGRMMLVRFEILALSADSIRFVQSVSADGGRSWTPNWIAVDTRVQP